MKTFFDSSAFAKRYINENGSDLVEELCCNATELGLSVICVPEIISALNRRTREKYLSPQQYTHAKKLLAQEVADATIIQISSQVITQTIYALETSMVRTLDALHLASAVQWRADIFVSADKQQIKAAHHLNLQTKQV